MDILYLVKSIYKLSRMLVILQSRDLNCLKDGHKNGYAYFYQSSH